MCIRKAHEYAESAVVLAKLDEDKDLQFKYRLAHCLTKRRMGEYLHAQLDLDQLFGELIESQ